MSVQSPRIAAAELFPISVGEIFHSAMRDPVCAGRPLFPARLANRGSDNTWATTHGWASRIPKVTLSDRP
jgi:hypothetical protein